MDKHFMTMISAAAMLFAAALTLAGQETAATAPKHAVVEFSANFMRENPEYEAELGDQALMGTIVEVLDSSSYWVKIKSPEPYTAWVNQMGLAPMSEEEIKDYLNAPKYICTANYTHIYSEPSAKSRIVSEFILGDIVRVMYKEGTSKAVVAKHFVGVILPSGKTGYVPAGDVEIFSEWASDKQETLRDEAALRASIVKTAERFVGVPYMWGGTSIKNVDCSGTSRSVYFANGVLLPRNASQQGRVGEDISIFKGGDVDWSNLLPGDLLFWGRAATETAPAKATHVGIYIGGGRFIHSSQVCRVNSLDKTAPDFYDRRPIMARRIIGQVDKEGSGIISISKSPYYFPQD